MEIILGASNEETHRWIKEAGKSPVVGKIVVMVVHMVGLEILWYIVMMMVDYHW